MVKAGLITGAAALVLIAAARLAGWWPAHIGAATLVGLAAGYLAGVFDDPFESEKLKTGAMAGEVAGLFGLLASLLAGIIGAVTRPLPVGAAGDAAGNWVAYLGGACVWGLLTLGLMTVSGMAGTALWSWREMRGISPRPSSFAHRMDVRCAVCGSRPDPSIYRPGVRVAGGDFGKCPQCGKVFCGRCKKIAWLDRAQTMWMGVCPHDGATLESDIFS